MVGGDEKPDAATGAGAPPEALDIEREGAPLPQELPPAPSSKSYKYDPAEDREKARAAIAQALVGILALMVLFAFLTLWFNVGPVKSTDLKDLLSILMGPVAALAGSATGFYFGGKTGSEEEPKHG